MKISKTLIFENRAQYFKVIIIKIFLSLLVAKLFTHQGTFLGTVLLNYFAFSCFTFH